MDSLHMADRSSLMSQIHQLRGQLEHLHQGESTEHGLIEKREGGGEQGAESERLLMEELKGELSQTKLELETTLKAQHKHLKEMDTLRLDEMQSDGRVAATATDADDNVGERTPEKKQRKRLPGAINTKLVYVLSHLEMSQHRCQ